MARYKLILAYDGTDFAGSQRQAGRRTVQGELEKALLGLGWRDRSVMLAGRTDTGVHAANQVVAFDLEWTHSLETLRDALNARLPWDMVVRKHWDRRMQSSTRVLMQSRGDIGTVFSASRFAIHCANASPGGYGHRSMHLR